MESSYLLVASQFTSPENVIKLVHNVLSDIANKQIHTTVLFQRWNCSYDVTAGGRRMITPAQHK